MTEPYKRTTTRATGAPQRRIAFYLYALEPGGLERVTLLLAEAFVARSYAVDLILERKQGAYLERVASGVRVVELATGGKWSAYRRLIRRWPRQGIAQMCRALIPGRRYIPVRRLLSLVRYIDDAQPDVIVAAAGRIPSLAIWARDVARFRTRVIIAEHSTYSRHLVLFRDDDRAYAALRHQRWLMRRLYPRADALIAVSDGVADDLATTAGIARAQIATIHNPVVSPELARCADQPVAHDWFEPHAPPVILAAGRLAAEKSFVSLVDAFALLRGQGRRARLMILGEGRERGAIEAKVAALNLTADVALPGWVDNPYAYMRRSAVFVLSSVFEGLPVALIEAMACGCPVVATDCRSGPREILDDGRYGPLVPVGDSSALAGAIAATLDAPLSADLLRSRSNDFTTTRAADAYDALIARVTTAAPSASQGADCTHVAHPQARADTPRVTVFIPAFNAERYIGEAIESVLCQSWNDFELLIIDDGSTDATVAVCKRYADDERVTIVANLHNRGRPSVRNEGVKRARGEYIALLDADDRCMPDRLAEQVAYLDAHSSIDVVGSWWHSIDETGCLCAPKKNRRYLSPDTVVSYLLFSGVIHNPTVMARARALSAYRYDPDFTVAEDYHLWARMIPNHRFAIIPKPLIYYRHHPTQASTARADESRARRRDIQGALLAALGLCFDDQDLVYHNLLYTGRRMFESQTGRRMDMAYVRWARMWLERLVAANAIRHCYPEPAFSRLVARLWWTVCCKATQHAGLGVWHEFAGSRLKNPLPRAWLADALPGLARGESVEGSAKAQAAALRRSRRCIRRVSPLRSTRGMSSRR